MPDHVHLILAPETRSDGWPFSLPEIMRLVKGRSAHIVNKHLGRQGPVWQDEFFDHVLRSHESLEEKLDYILMNPVRAGLVEQAGDYPWLWAGEAGQM